MQIAVCDDERKIAQEISDVIKEYASLEYEDVQVDVFDRGRALWERLSASCYDIVFLDIDMPDISGLDIAARMSELDSKPLLVFVTSHDELVYDSLKFHPFGFVRKNFLQTELSEVLRDCVQTLRRQKRDFSFVTSAGTGKVPQDSVLYFEANGNYLRLVTTDGEYRIRETLYAVENALGEYGFVRIHKGFLVNQAAVQMLGKEELVLSNEEKLPIGKSYAAEARRTLMRFMT